MLVAILISSLARRHLLTPVRKRKAHCFLSLILHLCLVWKIFFPINFQILLNHAKISSFVSFHRRSSLVACLRTRRIICSWFRLDKWHWKESTKNYLNSKESMNERTNLGHALSVTNSPSILVHQPIAVPVQSMKICFIISVPSLSLSDRKELSVALFFYGRQR